MIYLTFKTFDKLCRGKKVKLQLLFQDSEFHDRNEESVCYVSNLFVHLFSTNRLAGRYSRLQFIMSDSLVFSSNWRNCLLLAVHVRYQLTQLAQLAPWEKKPYFKIYSDLHHER